MTNKDSLVKAAELVRNAPKLAKGTFQRPEFQLNDEGYVLPIESWDWTSGRRETCYCTTGAVFASIEMTGGWFQGKSKNIFDLILLAIRGEPTKTDFPSKKVMEWSDQPERTKDEVVEVLERAAALA